MRLKALAVSEYRKLVSTRAWWILLIVTFLYTAFIALAFGSLLLIDDSISEQIPQMLSGLYGSAPAFVYVFPALAGALSVTGELRHGTIKYTILAVNERWQIIVAKLISGLPLGVIYGVISTIAMAAPVAIMMLVTDNPTGLDDIDNWIIMGRSVLALTIWFVLGIALGALLMNQVGVIIALVVWTQFVEPALRSVLAILGDPWADIAVILPGVAGESLTGQTFYSVATGELPHWSIGLLVMLVYVAIFSIVGALRLRKKSF